MRAIHEALHQHEERPVVYSARGFPVSDITLISLAYHDLECHCSHVERQYPTGTAISNWNGKRYTHKVAHLVIVTNLSQKRITGRSGYPPLKMVVVRSGPDLDRLPAISR